MSLHQLKQQEKTVKGSQERKWSCFGDTHQTQKQRLERYLWTCKYHCSVVTHRLPWKTVSQKTYWRRTELWSQECCCITGHSHKQTLSLQRGVKHSIFFFTKSSNNTHLFGWTCLCLFCVYFVGFVVLVLQVFKKK